MARFGLLPNTEVTFDIVDGKLGSGKPLAKEAAEILSNDRVLDERIPKPVGVGGCRRK